MVALTSQAVKEQRRELLEQREQLVAKIGDGDPSEAQDEVLEDIKKQDLKLQKRQAELSDLENIRSQLESPSLELPASRVVHAEAKEPDNGRGAYRSLKEQLEDVRTVGIPNNAGSSEFEAAMKRLQLTNAVGSDNYHSSFVSID